MAVADILSYIKLTVYGNTLVSSSNAVLFAITSLLGFGFLYEQNVSQDFPFSLAMNPFCQ